MFEVGCSVYIKPHSSYRGRFAGMSGIVINSGSSSIGVKIDEHQNPNSKYGCYWFAQNELTENTKNEQENDNLITGDFAVAIVRFLDGTNFNSTYEYAMFDNYLPDTICVVRSAHHVLGIAKIEDVIPRCKAKTEKFEREIVCAVDMTKYEMRLNRRKEADSLKAEMNKKVKELQDVALFELMAEKSPELKEMLERYKELSA